MTYRTGPLLLSLLTLACSSPTAEKPTGVPPSLEAIQAFGDSLAQRALAYPHDALSGRWSVETLLHNMQAYGLPSQAAQAKTAERWQYDLSELLAEYWDLESPNQKHYAGVHRYYYDSLGAGHLVLHTYNQHGDHFFDFTVAQIEGRLQVTEVFLYDWGMPLSQLMVRRQAIENGQYYGFSEINLPLKELTHTLPKYYAALHALHYPDQYDSYQTLLGLPQAYRQDPAWQVAHFEANYEEPEIQLTHLEEWEEHFPDNLAALYYRNRFQTNYGRVSYEKLDATLDTLENLVGPGPGLVHDRIENLFGRVPDAEREEHIREAISRFPHYHPLYYRLVYLLVGQKDWPALQEALTQAYDLAGLTITDIQWYGSTEFLTSPYGQAVAEHQGLTIQQVLQQIR